MATLNTTYNTPEDTAEQFDNICRFAKNVILKDVKAADNEENEYSKMFGDLMLKYFNTSLTYEDTLKLVTFVSKYNEAVDELLEDTSFKMKLYGLSKEQDYKKSIVHKIELLYGKNEFKYTLAKLKEIIGDDLTNTNIPNALIYSDLSYTIDNDLKNIIDNAFYALEDKEKILIRIKELDSISNNLIKNQQIDKLSASEYEKSMLVNSQLVFFDIVINYIYELNNETKQKILETLNIDLKSGSSEKKAYSILISYKELNPFYRNIINQEELDISLNYFLDKNTDKSVFKVFCNSLNDDYLDGTCITKEALSYFSNLSDIPILISDYPPEASETKKQTTKLFKYSHTNAFIVRNAEESEIICYYVGDPYISNNYGVYSYEKEEIDNFLTLYAQTRDYFYSVLLNESFINDSEYSCYEKSFLLITTIERFLSSKIENIKNIDSYNSTDMKNFLKSFGFDSLIDIIELNNFYKQEELSKRLAKNYISLMQNKGSRKIISVLENVFSLQNTKLNIFTNILVKDITSSSYKFVKSSYSESNILKSITENIGRASDFDSFVSNDKMWKTGSDDLEKYNVLNENTKYLTGQLTNEISEAYYVIRTVFAFLDFINSKNPNILGNLKISSKITTGSISVYEFITLIRRIYYKYLFEKKSASGDISYNAVDIVNKTSYNFNENNFKMISDSEFGKFFYTQTGAETTIKVNESKLYDYYPSFINFNNNKIEENNQISLIKNVLSYLLPLVNISNNAVTYLNSYNLSNLKSDLNTLLNFPELVFSGNLNERYKRRNL